MARYEEAIKYFAVVPKYRLKAMELAREEGLLVTDKKKLRGMTKDQIKEQEKQVIRQVIERKMDIRGVYAKPTYKLVSVDESVYSSFSIVRIRPAYLCVLTGCWFTR